METSHPKQQSFRLGAGGESYFPYILLNESHNLQSDQQRSCQRICVLIIRITWKSIDQRSNLVPRGRDPFVQRRGSGPVARWDFESANRGLPVTLRRIKSKTQDGGEKWSRYISGRREIWIRKSWKSKYYPQTETRRDPENNRFDAKRCFSRSPNWLRKIVNISNNATLDGLYGFWPETNPKEVYCLGGVTA